MFPEAVRAVRELRPRCFLFENVKGLLRQSFATYFHYVILQLSYPLVARKKDEHWESHLSRLERIHTDGKERDRRDTVLNHEFRDGARPCPGHTGSVLDEPSKALKAGDHVVPGGENMMALPDGTCRYHTVRESARVQNFPDVCAVHPLDLTRRAA